MIEAKCPKCGSVDFDEYNFDGGIDEGQMTIYCTCLKQGCDCVFDFKCEIIIIKSVEVK